MSMKLMTLLPVCHLATVSLLLLAVAACSIAPAEPIAGPVLPRRPLDAKTQLEYGNPLASPPRY